MQLDLDMLKPLFCFQSHQLDMIGEKLDSMRRPEVIGLLRHKSIANFIGREVSHIVCHPDVVDCAKQKHKREDYNQHE